MSLLTTNAPNLSGTAMRKPAGLGRGLQPFAAALLFAIAFVVTSAPAAFAQGAYTVDIAGSNPTPAVNSTVTISIDLNQSVQAGHTLKLYRVRADQSTVNNANTAWPNNRNNATLTSLAPLTGPTTVAGKSRYQFVYTVVSADLSNGNERTFFFGVVYNSTTTFTQAMELKFSPAFRIQPVADSTPPTLSLPADITTDATSLAGAAVSFTATATDANPASPAVTCTPASGSTFAIGATTVNCSATDAAGNPANGSFTVTVNKPVADIIFSDLTRTYDDSPKPATVTTNPAGLPLVITYNGSATVPTDAGDYTVAATVSGATHYQGNETATLTIGKATSTTTVTCTGAPFTYTGSAQTPCSAKVTGAGGLDQTFTPSYSNNVNAGTASASYSYAGDDNHNSSNHSVNFTIGKANATVNVSGYTGDYDGDAHGATGTAKGVQNEDLSSLLDLGASFTDAPGGTASWTFNGGNTDGNYNGASGTASIIISKANATISVTPYSVPYDGDPHTATGTATGVKGEDLSSLFNLSGTTHTNAGTYNGDAWSFSGNTNYNGTNGVVNNAIAKVNATIKVTGYTGTYDGDPHGASGTAKGVKNEILSGLDLGATFTNVPGGTANWTFTDATGNYNNDSGSVSIAISKAGSTVTVTCTNGAPFTYTGSAQTPCTAQATGAGMSRPVNVSGSLVYSNNVNAGAATAEASWAGDDNHEGSVGNGGFTINKANATINVSGYTGTYDGDAHSASGTAKGVQNEDLSGQLNLGSSFTNYPGGTANWSFTGGTNYNNANGSVAITINRANATINVTGYTGYYDGSAHGATGTATGVKGENLGSLLNLGSTYTNVPGGKANWTFNSGNTNGNYNSAQDSVDIIIKAWTLSGFYQPVDMSSTAGIVWNTIKGGSTVPLKFNLFVGTPSAATEKRGTTDVQGFAVADVPCGSVGAEDDIEFVTTGGTSLRYDATAGQFVQNWQTPKTAGRCYQVKMTAKDGSSLTAFFKTK